MAMATGRPAKDCAADAHSVSSPSPTRSQNTPKGSRRQPANAPGLATSASRASSGIEQLIEQPAQRLGAGDLGVIGGGHGFLGRGHQRFPGLSTAHRLRAGKAPQGPLLQQLGAEARGPLAVAAGDHPPVLLLLDGAHQHRAWLLEPLGHERLAFKALGLLDRVLVT